MWKRDSPVTFKCGCLKQGVCQVERWGGLVYNVMTRLNSMLSGGVPVANQTGKRYLCAKCGSEFIVTKGGNGAVHCCQQPMELKT